MPGLAVINAGELAACLGTGEEASEIIGVIEDGALLAEGGKIVWVGTTRAFKEKSVGRVETVDAKGGLVTPGFIDPHTHLAFAGSREDELERKVRGESYTEILASGGGISRTVRDTRRSTVPELVRQASERLRQLVRNGTTTVEVKTGYGQDVEDELKMLDAIAALESEGGASVVPTYLGLHAKPPEFKVSADYVDYAINKMLPSVGSAKVRPAFSDCFCEEGVFSRKECSRYLKASREIGLRLKVHADEFSDSGGASLAAEMGCVSADHLGKSSPSGVRAMAEKGVNAVLLPATSLFSSIPYADARGIIQSGCRVALGTDLSPNSWVESPQMVMSLACSGMKMTPEEALLGFTKNAAVAIGRDDIGFLVPGASADFVVHSIPSYRFLPYRVGGAYVREVFREGRRIFSAAPS